MICQRLLEKDSRASLCRASLVVVFVLTVYVNFVGVMFHVGLYRFFECKYTIRTVGAVAFIVVIIEITSTAGTGIAVLFKILFRGFSTLSVLVRTHRLIRLLQSLWLGLSDFRGQRISNISILSIDRIIGIKSIISLPVSEFNTELNFSLVFNSLISLKNRK